MVLRALRLAPPALLALATPALADAPSVGGFVPPVWTILPFAGMLLSIALFPLFAPKIWERHYAKVTLLWLLAGLASMAASVPATTPFLGAYGAKYFGTAEEYVAFIILLGALYIISGGIHVSGHLPGTPAVNTAILLTGAVTANLIGTTGASMVLIRPLLRATEHRVHRAHTVVFFIFLASNIGGVLTPIGDPPLFLGFLQGIPFEWTLRLLPLWAATVVPLLALYYALDRVLARREGLAVEDRSIRFRIAGKRNLLLLLGVIGAVVFSGVVHFERPVSILGLGEVHIEALIRDGGQIVLALLSLWLTAPHVRRGNNFNYGPIKEVAVLFGGIFVTMIPALMVLNARGGELGLDSPAKYFWVTGALSSFLDNAPTYLTFLAAAMGSLGLTDAVQMTHGAQAVLILEAVSAGAVFMGANTYIGNGPNFMVKAIAEQGGVKMPSFFGYMAYSAVILLPLFALLTLVFF